MQASKRLSAGAEKNIQLLGFSESEHQSCTGVQAQQFKTWPRKSACHGARSVLDLKRSANASGQENNVQGPKT
eukprot:CAMPEP_0175765972 /NCGR_PEP_ID=MMETSP0097-20121207/69095_1 /TAXON_ID=311494 /ORGANISM="Alexandrium monilatum, Strain CCMP3105" /LENGTH=72 /DNA_ID=CAMNT_0017075883 /DNA_START=30 /DNA_END=244 /DNA_ORIENTATION=-